MKVRKAKRRTEPKPKLQPKRTDLNTSQMDILRKVEELPEDAILLFEEMAKGSLFNIRKHENGFWDPAQIYKEFNMTRISFDTYIHAYIRVIRRQDEDSVKYYNRKTTSDSEQSPLGATPEGYFRWASSRIFLFYVLAITRVPSKAKEFSDFRKCVSKAMGISLGKKEKIASYEQVTTFEVRKTQ